MRSWAKSTGEGLAARVVLACLLLAACSCSPRTGANSSSALDFDLINLTGTTIKAVYVSPRDSEGWEENVLGDEEVIDGGSVEIRFSPEAKGGAWDLKVVGLGGKAGYTAEWKGLDLSSISKITLRVRNGIAVAEAE